MTLLLDTHIWIWSLLEPERLVTQVRHEMTAGNRELWLSPISVWECLVLFGKGRLSPEGEANGWVRDALVSGPFREATLNHEVAIRSRFVALPHEDPADRFICATADVYDLTLVTADARIIEADVVPTLANR